MSVKSSGPVAFQFTSQPFDNWASSTTKVRVGWQIEMLKIAKRSNILGRQSERPACAFPKPR